MSRTVDRLRAALVNTLVAALVCVAGVVWGAHAVGGANPGQAVRLGLIGPYSTASITTARSAGVSITLVEMTWRQAEPEPGHFDDAYLDEIAQQIASLRGSGFQIALNTGIQDAPAWALTLPGARFVDQYGNAYQGDVPNLVFDDVLRGLAQQYLDRVFARLGTKFALVRAGGGPSGELSYPYVFGPGGLVQNRYWAYDLNAMRTDPVPQWRPGQPSDDGEAAQFLNWYLDALVGFQNFQVSALRRAGYTGDVAMLYPSSGMRPGDFDAAVADNLSGTTSAEINGEVQRGYDFGRQIGALTDSRVVVYGTWGENLGVVDYLAELARRRGLEVMAENAGAGLVGNLVAVMRNAHDQHLAAFFLVRADTLLCATCRDGVTPQVLGAAAQALSGRN